MQEDILLAAANADAAACLNCPYADGCCHTEGCNLPPEEVEA
jgi:hypothetical protein